MLSVAVGMDRALRMFNSRKTFQVNGYQQTGNQKDGKQKEGNMKRTVLIAIVGTLFMVCGGASSGFCDEVEEVQRVVAYGALVDTYIQKCEAKAELLDSSSAQIRQSAIRATVKGAFLQSNRTDMIRYLMEKKAPLNADRVAYHLNQLYAGSVFPHEVYAALGHDRTEP